MSANSVGKEILQNMVVQRICVFQVFPISVVCILASIVAGFVCWLFETWTNREEFPRPFLIGWFEGFWWSFISLTTVGYGDKSPRTFWGRMFSVLWITLGTIAYGLVTGVVVAEVMKINSPPPPDMKSKVIGSLLYREYDSMIVAQNGGLLHPQIIPSPEPVDFYEDALVMINNLRKKKIKGFVMDIYTFWTLNSLGLNLLKKGFANFSKYKLITQEDANRSINYFLGNTETKEIKYQGSKRFTYGILAQQKTHYDYFVDMIRHRGKLDSQRIEISWNHYVSNAVFAYPGDIKLSENLSPKETHLYVEETNNLLSHKALAFKVAIGAVCCLIVCIIVVGSAYEYKRTGCTQRHLCVKDSLEEDEEIDMERDGRKEKKLMLVERTYPIKPGSDQASY